MDSGDISIPKIIHQTWKTSDVSSHSQVARLWRVSLNNFFWEWEKKLWTDKDIINLIEGRVKEELPEFYKIYHHLPLKIMKIDFVRYLWMYMYGWIYMDLDIIYHKKEQILSPGYNVFFIKRAWYTAGFRWVNSVHQAWLASSKQHPIWLEIMRYIWLNIEVMGEDVLNLTGPNGISKAIDDLWLLKKYRDVAILDDKYLYQKNWSVTKKEACVMEHIPVGSWLPKIWPIKKFLKKILIKLNSAF